MERGFALSVGELEPARLTPSAMGGFCGFRECAGGSRGRFRLTLSVRQPDTSAHAGHDHYHHDDRAFRMSEVPSQMGARRPEETAAPMCCRWLPLDAVGCKEASECRTAESADAQWRS